VWDQNPLERDSLVTVRRCFHTLKGSGRMVGARELGEFAWSIENLVNRLLDNTLTRSPAILETLRAAVAALPELIEQLESGTPVRSDIAAISSRAHALAAGRQSGAAPAAEAAEEEATAEPPGATAPGATSTVSRTYWPDAAPQGEAAAAAAEPMDSVPDDTLRDIYARETAAHVATVRAYLAREAPRSEPHELPEDVYRACHTLSGSSKMAQARHGIRLAEPLDHWLRRAFSSGLGVSTRELTLLQDCMASMEAVATHLDESTGYFVSHWQLLERIEAAERDLDERIAAAAPDEVPPGEAAATAQAEPDEAEEVADFDPEVAAIFTDEATELIEASEHALSDWRSQPESSEYRLSLKRPLHTLKGGARMAGITPMGNLSHELESLVMLVDTGKLTADAVLFDAIQASLDELARMRELVATGQRVTPARAMIARLQQLSRPSGVHPALPPGTEAPAAPRAGIPGAPVAAPPAPAAPPRFAGPESPPGPATSAAMPSLEFTQPTDPNSETTLTRLNTELRLADEEPPAAEEIVLSAVNVLCRSSRRLCPV